MKEKSDSETIPLDTHQQLRAYLAQSEKAAKQKSTADDSHRRHTGQREPQLSAPGSGAADRRAYRYRILSVVHRSRSALKKGQFDEAVEIARQIPQIEAL